MLPIETGREIDLMLAEPIHEMETTALVSAFRARIIRVTVPGVCAREEIVFLADAFRGALGHALLEQASPEAREGRPCPWRPACALDVLWRERPFTTGMSLPKPVNFAVEPGRESTDLVIRLFGLATGWSNTVAEAAVRAVRAGIRARNGSVVPAAVTDVGTEEIAGLSVPSATFTHIVFHTPLRWRSQASCDFDPGLFLTMLGNRISGLARWHGVLLRAPWQEVRSRALDLQWNLDAFHPVGMVRRSGRQMRNFSTDAWSGQIDIAGNLDFLGDLLLLGSLTGAGSNAALGLGAYGLKWC